MDCLVRGRCVVTLPRPLGTPASLGRIKYTGGYVLPGDPDPTPIPMAYPPVRLPADVEHAAIEQAAAWYLNGILRLGEAGGRVGRGI